jgi:hypothetical protein
MEDDSQPVVINHLANALEGSAGELFIKYWQNYN